MSLSPAEYEVLYDSLVEAIVDAMKRDEDLMRDAIKEGRIGLDEMTERELIELAQDYGVGVKL